MKAADRTRPDKKEAKRKKRILVEYQDNSHFTIQD